MTQKWDEGNTEMRTYKWDEVNRDDDIELGEGNRDDIEMG